MQRQIFDLFLISKSYCFHSFLTKQRRSVFGALLKMFKANWVVISQ